MSLILFRSGVGKVYIQLSFVNLTPVHPPILIPLQLLWGNNFRRMRDSLPYHLSRYTLFLPRLRFHFQRRVPGSLANTCYFRPRITVH